VIVKNSLDSREVLFWEVPVIHWIILPPLFQSVDEETVFLREAQARILGTELAKPAQRVLSRGS
jgi:hypothetical protein